MLLAIECVICCIFFTLIIMPAQYKDPLVMIKSYPPAIVRRVESLPQYKDVIATREKKHIRKKIFGVVFFVLFLAGVAYVSGCRTFAETFLHVFTIFLVVNLYDMLVLDWGIFCHSRKLRIPGTEDMDKEYKDKWFHAKGALIGCALGLVVSTLSGCIVHFALL